MKVTSTRTSNPIPSHQPIGETLAAPPALVLHNRPPSSGISRVSQNDTTDRPPRALPEPTPETTAFWEGAREGRLIIQRCDDCDHAYFPPRPFCPSCGSRSVSDEVASGQATLYSYVINQRPPPAFEGPVAVAVVELAEGPRMMTNIVDTPQTEDALVLDMALEVVFERQTDEITLPLFRPVGGSGS